MRVSDDGQDSISKIIINCSCSSFLVERVRTVGCTNHPKTLRIHNEERNVASQAWHLNIKSLSKDAGTRVADVIVEHQMQVRVVLRRV